jgi:hypothetical protein
MNMDPFKEEDFNSKIPQGKGSHEVNKIDSSRVAYAQEEDDDEHFDTNIEDWLAKRNELEERNRVREQDSHFDTNIEDWLAKRNELEERNRVREQYSGIRRSQLVKDGTDEQVDDAKIAAIAAYQNDVKPESMKASQSDESGKKTLIQRDWESTSLNELQDEAYSHVLYDRAKSSPLRLSFTEELAVTPPSLLAHFRLPAAPGAQRIGGTNLHLGNTIISEGQGERYGADHEEVELPSIEMDASVRVFERRNTQTNWCLAELSPPMKDPLVIEGVRTANPWRRRALIALGAISLTSLVALSAGLVTSRLLAVNWGSDRQTTPPSTQSDNASPRTISPLSNPNWTYADYWLHEEARGVAIGIFLSSVRRQMFLRMANRTDTNFTFFSAVDDAKVLEGISPSLLSKAFLPEWTGHAVSTKYDDAKKPSAAPFSLFDTYVLLYLRWMPLRALISLDMHFIRMTCMMAWR